MVGRRPKPTALKVVEGTFRKDRAPQNEVAPAGDLVDAPAHFTADQRAVWDYAVAHAPANLLKLLDLSVLEVWAVACVFHRQAAAKVLESGQVVVSPSGYPIVNPYLSNMNKQAQIMLKASAEMGFTPASRARVSLGDAPKTPKRRESEFGL